MDRSVVGIDIGTQRILILVGEIGEQGDVRIVGVGRVPAKGIKKGVVVNVAQATAAIAEAVEQAEQSSGYQIERGFLGITGAHITSRNSTGVVGVTRRDRGIAPDDVDRVLEAAGAIVLPAEPGACAYPAADLHRGWTGRGTQSSGDERFPVGG